jgi:hypothetical protein
MSPSNHRISAAYIVEIREDMTHNRGIPKSAIHNITDDCISDICNSPEQSSQSPYGQICYSQIVDVSKRMRYEVSRTGILIGFPTAQTLP